MKQSNRTIIDILNIETGEIINANSFFKEKKEGEVFDTRYKLEQAIQSDKSHLVCLYCKQKVKLSGGKNRRNKNVIYHFRHLKDSDDCNIKTDQKFSKDEIKRIKYNGAKESDKHIFLKNFIADYLKKSANVLNVQVEKVFKDKKVSRQWRKPDVSCILNGVSVVSEIQLSTTFLDVIVARQEFYKKNDTYILWIFNHFSTDEFSQRFTQKDVFYSNKNNAFVLDEFSIHQSKVSKELILKCTYQKPLIKSDNIVLEWRTDFVKLSELKFDSSDYSIYYYDTPLEYSARLKDLDRIVYNKTSPLQLIFKNIYIENIKEEVYNLFLEGFEVKKYDKDFLTMQLKEEVDKERYEDLVYALIFVKIKNPLLYKKVPIVRNVLYSLISFKLGRVIGFDFPNFKSVVHNEFYHRPQFGQLILKGLGHYNQLGKLLSTDKKGKLKDKINKIDNIEQDENYDDLFKDVLPELFR